MSTNKKTRAQLQLLRDEALDRYLNREAFQYDLNGDALYQQYKDRYQELGKSAMIDTMGQAAALTGGYGSSYAQNVGQQAYQGYLKQLGDVVPELYQLAYDRYQSKGDQLYKAYQSWSQLEQQQAQEEYQAAQLEQKAAELAAQREHQVAQLAAQREHQAAQLAAQREQQEAQQKYQAAQLEHQKAQLASQQEHQAAQLEHQKAELAAQQEYRAAQLASQKEEEETSLPKLDYYAWLSTYQGQGQRLDLSDPTVTIRYDNQNVSTGNIMEMQRALGLEETGMWTLQDRKAAGGMTADTAFAAYRKGQLQNRQTLNLGDTGVRSGDIRSMERALGTVEDGVWGEADRKAAGGLSAVAAYEAYKRGQLQMRR